MFGTNPAQIPYFEDSEKLKCCQLESYEWEIIKMLGDRDSNPDTVVQSHVSCRWTISQFV
jgi:hypothetical protein